MKFSKKKDKLILVLKVVLIISQKTVQSKIFHLAPLCVPVEQLDMFRSYANHLKRDFLVYHIPPVVIRDTCAHFKRQYEFANNPWNMKNGHKLVNRACTIHKRGHSGWSKYVWTVQFSSSVPTSFAKMAIFAILVKIYASTYFRPITYF